MMVGSNKFSGDPWKACQIQDCSDRSVTITVSPVRKMAPEGPAKAYWPKTGLSVHADLAK
jgi:hypothetical protein